MNPLGTFVVETPIDARDAVGWVLRLSGALSALHRQGEVHGRLSASAIVVSGVAAEARGRLAPPSALRDAPLYHSPERLAGSPPCPDDDVWAAGVLLYELLTATMPFHGATRAELAARIASGPPPPFAVFDVGDDELQLVLDRLFAPRRADRFTRIHQLRGALLSWAPDMAGLAPLPLSDADDLGEDGDSIDDEWSDESATAIYSPLDDASFAATLAKLRHDEAQRAAASPEASAPEIDARSLDLLVDPDDGLALLDTRDGGARLSDMRPLSDPAPPPAPPGPPPAPPAHPPRLRPPLPRAAPPTPEAALREAVAAAPVAESEAPASMTGGDDVPATHATPEAVAASSGLTSRAIYLAIGGFVAAGVVAAAMTLPESPAPTPTVSSNAVAEEPAPRPTAPPESERPEGETPESETPESETPDAPVSAPAPVASSVEADVAACLAPLFPEDTFQIADRGLQAICKIDDAVEGASEIRTRVVLAGRGRGVTRGMREWSALGWYGMAAFAIARARCCAATDALVTPRTVQVCAIDERLTEIAGAVSRGDAATTERALAGYRQAVGCLFQGGNATLFGQKAPPTAGELTVFRRILKRALALRR